MGSNAFHVLLLPACLGVGLGLVLGMAIRLVLGQLSRQLDRSAWANGDRRLHFRFRERIAPAGQAPAERRLRGCLGESR